MTTAHVAFPRVADDSGRTATSADADAYLRTLIEQVLFTAPGERINRPQFGSGLHQLVFAPNDSSVAAATQVTVQGALQTWLGDLIEVSRVQVHSDEATLEVHVAYRVRATGGSDESVFRRPR
jgi:uncharacterized protein